MNINFYFYLRSYCLYFLGKKRMNGFFIMVGFILVKNIKRWVLNLGVVELYEL